MALLREVGIVWDAAVPRLGIYLLAKDMQNKGGGSYLQLHAVTLPLFFPSLKEHEDLANKKETLKTSFLQ